MIDTNELKTRGQEAQWWARFIPRMNKYQLRDAVESAFDIFEKGRPNMALGLCDFLGPERVRRLAREAWVLCNPCFKEMALREHPAACRELGVAL